MDEKESKTYKDHYKGYTVPVFVGHQDEWISVEDRLPVHFREIDCYHPDWGVRTSWLDKSENYIIIGLSDTHATYWRERPQPPTSKNDDSNKTS